MLIADQGLLERYFPSTEGHDGSPPTNIGPADLALLRSAPLVATSHDPRDPNVTPRLGYRSSHSNSIPHANMNGNSMVHSNGIRHRPVEVHFLGRLLSQINLKPISPQPPMEQHYIVDQPLKFLPPELNGSS